MAAEDIPLRQFGETSPVPIFDDKVPSFINELAQESTQTQDIIEKIGENENSGRLAQILHVGKRAVQTTVILAELGPVNEMVRYGAFAASQVGSSNPLVGAAVLGGTTFAVEAGAALASADIISKSSDGKVMGWVRDKLGKIFKRPPPKPSPITEAGLAMVGGTVVVNTAKQIAEPERTTSDNRRHGVMVAGLMSGYFATEGALMSKGIETLGVYKTVGASILVFAGVQLLFNKVATGRKERKGEENDGQSNAPGAVFAEPSESN